MATALFDGLGLVGLALSINRMALGTFFVSSGFHKLFNPTRHRAIDATMVADHIPEPHVMAWVVAAFEFMGGLSLLFGLLAPLASVALLCICLVATCTDGLKRIPSYHPLDWDDFLCDVLYLPEVLYCTMLLVVVLAGGGNISIDALISALVT